MQSRDLYEFLYGLAAVISGALVAALIFTWAALRGSDTAMALAIACAGAAYFGNVCGQMATGEDAWRKVQGLFFIVAVCMGVIAFGGLLLGVL